MRDERFLDMSWRKIDPHPKIPKRILKEKLIHKFEFQSGKISEYTKSEPLFRLRYVSNCLHIFIGVVKDIIRILKYVAGDDYNLYIEKYSRKYSQSQYISLMEMY